MNRILTCPHCGPTLTAARLRCDRCGRELVSVSEAEFSAGTAPAAGEGQPPLSSRRFVVWTGVSAAAVLVVALAGLALPGAQPQPATPDAASLMMAAPAPAPLTKQPRETGRTAADVTAAAPPAAARPGDLAQALEHYRAALAEKPADAELLGNVGRILVAMNQPADAVPFLEQALQAEPFSIVARFDLAVAYGRSGKLKEAVEQYESLVQAGSADARAYHNLGLALRQLGRNGDAAAAFQRAAALEPGRAPVWMGLALSLEADGRAGDAVAALERYLSLEPTGPDADNVRARIARLRAAASAEAPAEPAAASSRR